MLECRPATPAAFLLAAVQFSLMVCAIFEGFQYEEASDSIVLGHAGKKLENAFSYMTNLASLPYGLVLLQYLWTAADPYVTSTKSVILCLLAMVVYEVPIATLAYSMVRCRNFYITNLQLASAIIQIASAVLMCTFLICVFVSNRKDMAQKNKRERLQLGICTIFLVACVGGVLAVRSRTLLNMNRLRNYNPQLERVSLLLLRHADLGGRDSVYRYNLGGHLSTYGKDVNDVMLVNSLISVVHSRSWITHRGEGRSQFTYTENIFSTSMPCANISSLKNPDCDNGTSLNFTFSYVKPNYVTYGPISYNCTVSRNTTGGGTCTEGCESLQHGWRLYPLQVEESSGGRLVTSPWQEIQSCGPGMPLDTTSPVCSLANFPYCSSIVVSLLSFLSVCYIH